jgi:hypothetical protein
MDGGSGFFCHRAFSGSGPCGRIRRVWGSGATQTWAAGDYTADVKAATLNELARQLFGDQGIDVYQHGRWGDSSYAWIR